MKRLILLHSLGYFAAFGIAAIAITLQAMSEPTHLCLQVSDALTDQEAFARGEDALAAGLTHYLSATQLERRGTHAETMTDLLQQAQDHLQTAISLGLPRMQLAEAYFLLGDSYLHGDLDPVKAETSLERALKLDSHHLRAARSLARAYSLMGLALQEAQAWERALEIMPEDSAAHQAAALAYFRAPISDRVERAYGHALVAARSDPAVRVQLAPIFDAAEGPYLQSAEADELNDIIDHDSQRKLSDDEAERYVREITEMLGESTVDGRQSTVGR